jgi:hypothetical protein
MREGAAPLRLGPVLRRAALTELAAAATRMTLPQDMPEREINALIEFVVQSDRAMGRNGKRHDSTTAADHLRRKREAARHRVQTAGQVIDGVASRRSVSGRPYLVSCPGQRVVSSSGWRHGELTRLRTQAPR